MATKPKHLKKWVRTVVICCACKGEARMLGDLATEGDVQQYSRGSTALSYIAVSVAVVVLCFCLRGLWESIQRRLKQRDRNRQRSVNSQLSVEHQSSSHNSPQDPVNVGHVPTAYAGVVTVCPTFRDGQGIIVHRIQKTGQQEFFQQNNLIPVVTLAYPLNANGLRTYHNLDELKRNDVKYRLNQGAQKRQFSVNSQRSINHPSSVNNTTQAPINLGHKPTAYDGDAITCPTFRDENGIVHGIRTTELPKCFQKETITSKDTLVDQLKRIKQLLGPDMTEDPLARSTNRFSYQDATALIQDEMNTEPEQNTPCYINEMGKVPFIVTEEPYPSTLELFWNLIWEDNVPVIVNLSERKENLATHIPLPTFEQESHCGKLTFTLLKTTERLEYSLKEIIAMKKIDFRHIYICHFFVWPKDGIPEHPLSVIGFIKKLKSLYQGHSGPILVFSNDGLKRSAAFVTIFTLMEHLKTKERIRVQDFIVHLILIHRDMVPNQDLYNFIFEALAAASFLPMEDIQVPSLLGMDLSGNKYWFKMRREYQALLDQKSFGTQAVSKEGCTPINISSNRLTDIVPLDPNRPVWDLTDNDGAPNYVIATLVDSFWSHNGIIIAQSPLSNTIEDFWKMVLYYNCAAFVALDTVRDHDGRVPQYWLNASHVKYGRIIVECPQELSERRGILEKRKMYVRHEKLMTTLDIDHFVCLKWPTSNSNVSSLLDIFVEIQPLLKEKKRIVLHCLDGEARSSVVAAVSTELGRVKEDGVVDLFQTVFKLRRRHPQAIKCEEEYDFCYTLLNAALTDFRNEF